MKLRLHAGSLRLRLSQSDVARLRDTGKVEEAIFFAPGSALSFGIEAGPVSAIDATLKGGDLRVTLPVAVANQWAESDQTGLEASTGTLKIVVEKDFQCLHREPEPGEDAFPNPLASI